MSDPRNIVTAIEKDGDDIDAQYAREDGEVLIGCYKRIGWKAAPQAVKNDINERLRLPPSMTETTRR